MSVRDAAWMVAPAAVCLLLAGCGSPAAPGSHPSGSATSASSASSSATPQLIGTTRTVLTPLGLVMHSEPVLSVSNHVGSLQQGATVSVLDYQPQGGGWYKVMGQTTTGWIVADPSLTAQGTFTSFSSDAFNALYPEGWTFRAESPGVVRFVPMQQGQESIVVATAASTSAFPSASSLGYTSTYSQEVVPCGYTGELFEYTQSSGAASPPSPGVLVPNTTQYAEIRLRFDAAHAMLIAFDYSSKDQLPIFQNFYNAISYPYPQCELGVTPPGSTASPTPAAT